VSDSIRADHPRQLADLCAGFACGLVGFLVAIWVFGYVGLFTGGADVADSVASGLLIALLVAAAPAMVVPIVALRALRRRPHRAVGYTAGWIVGVAVMVQLVATVYPALDDLPSTCPCEAPFEQLTVNDEV
jgi:membrane protease YdiL (CAAX protease family)